MRMIDRSLDLDILATQQPVPGLATRTRKRVATIIRVWLNRRAVRQLNELDDHELLDLGLRRSDVDAARTSTFFSDTGLHLTIAARERARRHLRRGYPD